MKSFAEETKGFVIEACITALLTLAKNRKVDHKHLSIRVDKENLAAKPIFGLFNKSDFHAHCTLNEIICAGGGRGITMLLANQVRNIFRDIFLASMKQFEITDTKRIFVLLYLKEEDSKHVPMIAIYKDKVFMAEIPVGDTIGDPDEMPGT